LEEIEQLYSGAKLTIEDESLEAEKEEVDHELVSELRDQIGQFRKENCALRIQAEGLLPVDQRMTPQGYHVHLRGLPYTVTKDDVTKFFEELSIVEDGVWILPEYSSTMARGEALVTFTSESDQEAAIKKHGEKIGSRWLDIRNGTEQDFLRYQKILEGYRFLAYPNFEKRYIAKLRGFEWAHKEEDVESFLDPIVPVKIWIIYTKRGSNSGVVYVELSDENVMKKTLAKKKEYFGERWIDVWETSDAQFRFDLAQMCGQELNQESFIKGARNIKMDGLPREATDQDIAKFFRSVGVLPIRIHRKNTGEHAYVEFLSESECKVAMTKQNQHIRDRFISLKAVTTSDVASVVPQAVAPLSFHDRRHGEVRSRSSYQPHNTPATKQKRFDPYGKGVYNTPPSPTLKMKGLPFNATRSDISRFWADYKIIPDSIKILEKNGMATGMGRITFQSIGEAERGLQERNGKYLGERYVELSFWR